MGREDKNGFRPGTDLEKREKKHYHVVRKNKADVRAVFRGIVSAYLIYLGWDLIRSGGSDPTFPVAVGWLAGGLFIAAALGFGWYTWKQYKQALQEAELTPQEEEELRREREE